MAHMILSKGHSNIRGMPNIQKTESLLNKVEHLRDPLSKYNTLLESTKKNQDIANPI